MSKKRFSFFVMSLFMTLGVAPFSHISNKEVVRTHADENKVYAEFNSIVWNNLDYSYYAGTPWSGELLPNNAPKDGYCIIAGFNEPGKTMADSVIGNINTTGRGVINKGYDIETKIRVNGVNIDQVVNSKVYIYPSYGLFFYLPHDSILFDETHLYPVLELDEGIHFNDVYLPKISFEFRGELGQASKWIYVKDASEYNHFDFRGVPTGWNNTALDSSHNQSILQFGEWGQDYLKADHVSDSTNLVSKYSDSGLKITINGVPLGQIEDTSVSYIHGYCYVYFVFPLSALNPSNGYKIVTLHISSDTMFYDTLLPEVNLYLFKGEWVTTKPEAPEDSEYTGAFSLSDIFNCSEATLNSENRQLTGSKTSSLETFGLFINYKVMSCDSTFVLYALGKTNQNGLRLVFSDNSITLFDSTQSNISLKTITLEPFAYDEWYALFFYTRVVDNKLSIYVAIDDLIYIHLDNVNLSNRSNIGNSFSLVLGSGEASFKNAVLGEDNKKPVLSYVGKAVYGVLEGSDILDFSIRCSAFDAKDGDISNSICYQWPDGSITNNKINKGTWEVRAVAEDKAHNIAELSITVIATNKLEVTVTFDNENPTTYRIGDSIALVPDPIKEGDGTTSYRFIGWYYNGRLWDFENDYVICDMNLESKFQETVEEYRLFVSVEGLSGTNSYVLYLAYGTRINMSVFAVDGYSLKAYVNDIEVESITITQDIELKLVYTSTKPHKQDKKGCGGSIIAASVILSTLSLLGLGLLIVKKKGDKEHE